MLKQTRPAQKSTFPCVKSLHQKASDSGGQGAFRLPHPNHQIPRKGCQRSGITSPLLGTRCCFSNPNSLRTNADAALSHSICSEVDHACCISFLTGRTPLMFNLDPGASREPYERDAHKAHVAKVDIENAGCPPLQNAAAFHNCLCHEPATSRMLRSTSLFAAAHAVIRPHSFPPLRKNPERLPRRKTSPMLQESSILKHEAIVFFASHVAVAARVSACIPAPFTLCCSALRPKVEVRMQDDVKSNPCRQSYF